MHIRALIQDLNARFTEYKLKMVTPTEIGVALLIWELTGCMLLLSFILFFEDLCSRCDYVTHVFYDSALYSCVDGKDS